MILVDEAWYWYRGERWCHMVSDTSLDELHEFARRIHLSLQAFQDNPKRNHPHYDLDEVTRARAIELGAMQVSSKELVRRMWRYPHRPIPEWAEPGRW